MTARKQTLPRTPAYVSRATLAAELEVSESTIDDMVKRGTLPKPTTLSTGCVRWSWDAVRAALASIEGQSENTAADPVSAGTRRALQIISEGRR
jgi:predicted DNA-binding transcriptional regulator AlpA